MGPPQSFREWLAARLLGTKYATVRISDDRVDAIAKRLGVDTDLLLEVRAQARLALHDRGLSPARSNAGGTQEGIERLYQYQMWMPPQIHAAWMAECELRSAHPPTFLRSLIHDYLMGSHEPASARRWFWKGKPLPTYVKGSSVNEHTVITLGARRALMRRSRARGAQAANVVRALVLEAMAGEHRDIPQLTAAMMYDDETRYYTGDPLSLDPGGGSR